MTNIENSGSDLMELMRRMGMDPRAEFKSAPKSQSYNFDLKNHVNKSLEQIKSEIQEAGKETLVIEDVMLEALPKRMANLNELAYPAESPSFSIVSQALKAVTRQGHAKGISRELYDEMFTSRMVSLEAIDQEHQKDVMDKYIEDARPIVEAFIKQMAPLAQQHFTDNLKYAAAFRDILAEVLHFTVNYTPSNESGA